MAFVNYNNKEITIKIVYYGPALSGKTTCLRHIYTSKKFRNKGKLITLDTDGDRTLFFDFLPVEIGKMGDYSVKIQLYTVPGQVAYDTTRKLVLQGADGVVFVADSQVSLREQNIESFENLKTNLRKNNILYSEVPIILQYNKRDLQEILPIADLNKILNAEKRPFFETIATDGTNILEGLHNIMKLVLVSLKSKLSIFQKDKTVMFSREEITTPTPTEGQMMNNFDSTDPEINGDSDNDDIFELDRPLEDSGPLELEPTPVQNSNFDSDPGQDVEIFDLEDSVILKMNQDMDMSGSSFADELSENKSPTPPAPKPEPSLELPDTPQFQSEPMQVSRTQEITVDPSSRVANVPINLTIPPGIGEVQINLNLRIKINNN